MALVKPMSSLHYFQFQFPVTEEYNITEEVKEEHNELKTMQYIKNSKKVLFQTGVRKKTYCFWCWSGAIEYISL